MDYLAPEYILSGHCDTASDMFSVGVLFHAIYNHGDRELIADFSVNAARRLALQANDTMTIELPKGRLKAFGPAER